MSPSALDASTMAFPVLSFSKGVVLVTRSAEELTTCRKAGLNRGWFDTLLVVDSAGRGWSMAGARKMHGVGLLWGYNVFLNQKIRVELLCARGPFDVSVEDVRGRVLKSLDSWPGWEAAGDSEELRDAITVARSIPEMISTLEHHQLPQRHSLAGSGTHA
jgi:hypothetical protein